MFKKVNNNVYDSGFYRLESIINKERFLWLG